MSLPLAGVTVLDLTHFVAGPWCTMMLADLGAEVTKIEPPAGEIGRSMGGVFAGGESAIFLGFNRNKRSVALDLKDPRGRAAARMLAMDADVVVQNFRPGIATRLGMDAPSLRRDHARLVHCSISAFGDDGPYAHLPANDPLVQGISGALNATGSENPTRMGVSLPDFAAGALTAIAASAALLQRDRTGQGCAVDLNLLDAQMFAQVDVFAGAGPTDRSLICRCADDTWLWLDDVPGALAALNLDPDLGRAGVVAGIARRPRAEWLTTLGAAGVSCAPVQGSGDVLADHSRRTVVTEHPTAGELRSCRTPVDAFPAWEGPERPAPLLGEHTHDVLLELGYSPAEVSELTDLGVARGPDLEAPR